MIKDPRIQKFAEAMERAVKKSQSKYGNYEDYEDYSDFTDHFFEEVEELRKELGLGCPTCGHEEKFFMKLSDKKVAKESVDVANMAFMFWQLSMRSQDRLE